jgi:hypothetical protein
MGYGGAHEHQWITGELFVYLVERGIRWRKLSTGGSSSGGSGGRRLGVREIPAEGSWKLGWVGSRCWRRGWRSNRSKELGRGGGGSTNFRKRRTAASLVLGDREEEEGEMQ